MAKGGSIIWLLSGNLQQLNTSGHALSDFYFIKRCAARNLIFHWLLTGQFLKMPVRSFRSLHHEKSFVKIIKRLNEVPAFKYVFSTFVIINTIITLPGISFGRGNKKLSICAGEKHLN